MIKIFDLKTEYIKNPLAIENLKPRFSYKLYSDKCFFQKSYRIIVAASKELLTKNIGDMWDSGEVLSGKSVGIEYQGKPLQSRQKLFWKVIVDNIESVEEATFEMGLFDKSLWWGRWIGMPMNFHGNSILLRTKLTVPSDKEVIKARAYIAGLGCHEVFLNGNQIGEEKLNPSVSVYSKKVYYCTYPLDLKKGDNVFGVELGYGWYGSRMLLGQIFIDYSDGTVEHMCTESGERWWLSSGAMETNSIYGGEIFNANNYNRKWCTNEFTPDWDNGWMYSVGVDSPSGKLTSQTMEGMKFVDTYYPVSENKFCDNNIVYDIGQNISGVASITVKGEKNSKVILRYGERLAENGRINQLNLRTAKCEDIYILSGDGEENYTPKFTYHGFQYVEVLIEGKAEIIALCGKHLRNAVDKIGEFECSDQTINRLHKMAQMTESNNLQGVMTDCPQRDERFGWLNDLSSRIYQCVNNFSYARFLPKFVGDITDAQADNGAISDTVSAFCRRKTGRACKRLYNSCIV